MIRTIEKIGKGIVIIALTPVILGIIVLGAFVLCLPLIVMLKTIGWF